MWRQVTIPENGHQGILLISVKRKSDWVDRAPGWMGSIWPPEVTNLERQPGSHRGGAERHHPATGPTRQDTRRSV